jgi:hypothetical protein
MTRKRMVLILSLAVAGLLLVTCGGSEPDRVATRVAEDLAVAATLTASAPPPQAPPTSAPVTPTASESAAAATDTPEAVATNRAPAPTLAPTSTAPAPTPAPTNTEAAAPPTPTPIVIAVLPVDGGGGDVPNIRNNNPVKGGRNITLPGFTPAEASEPMVFRDRMVFQAEVFDANVGTYDGAGIDNVRFTIADDLGRQVHFRQENNAGYCVFGGGEPDCTVLNFADAGYRWPDGESIFPVNYSAIIDIKPQNGDTVSWFWSFSVQFAKHMARIDGITQQGNQYAVDFETFGYSNQLPGEHVHFFFNTVPPDQAGTPGKGPWKLYGGPSPFTEYGVGERPQGATQMCILVANADHSVQANSGNCVDLP